MEGVEGPTVGTEPSAYGTPMSIFSCKTHAHLSSRLIEECPHSLIERALTGSFECKGLIMLLVLQQF
jgi:hypothetical protein